ncbi:MAG: glycosyltransferase family 9 protein [Deltaproteobacteria bacterium]|nr:glycosyltransferase family 9 protein [Deltaproteobacteria bacterium]
MHPDVMRKIDRWVGVPLCFVLTIYERLVRLFRKNSGADGPIKRLLFIELAEVGAFAVAYPAVAHARRLFPGADIFFLTFSRGPEIIRLMGAVDPENLIIIRTDNWLTFVWDTWRTIRRLRREKFDVTINLEVYARFSTILGYLSGAGRRAGFYRFHEEGAYLGDLVTHKVIYNPHRHAAYAYVTLVQAITENPDHQPQAKINLDQVSLELPKLKSTPEARQVIRKLIQEAYPALNDHHRIVLLNPNASDMVAARRWPEEYFLELGRGLLADSRTLIVFTGAKDERTKTETLTRLLGSDRVINLAGRTTLAQLIDLYNFSRLLVTNDSGPAHFASLTDLPVLVLFGPETPIIFGPLSNKAEPLYLGLACSPCVSPYNQKKSPCRDNLCLKGIHPRVVLAKARRILEMDSKDES